MSSERGGGAHGRMSLPSAMRPNVGPALVLGVPA